MKIISYQEIKENLFTMLKRFPFAFATSLLFGLLSYFAVYDVFEKGDVFGAIMVETLILIPLFVAVKLYSERKKLKEVVVQLLRLLVLAFALVLYFLLFNKGFDFWIAYDNFYTFNLFFLSYLLFLFGGFSLASKESSNFWSFVVHFLLSLLTSIFYFGFVFIALAIFYSSLDFFFDFSVDGEVYGITFFMITSFLAIPFVLIQIDKFDGAGNYLEKLTKNTSFYNFVTYLVFPVATLYVSILSVYSIFYLISFFGGVDFSWLRSDVSFWIIFYFIFLVSTYFLIFPLRVEKKFKKVKRIEKIFLSTLIPLSLVLSLSLYELLVTEGISFPIYYGFLFVIWVLLFAFFFLFNKTKKLIFIPVSLFVLLFLSAFTPYLNAKDLVLNERYKLALSILDDNGLVENGSLVKERLDSRNKDLRLEHDSLENPNNYINKTIDYLVNYKEVDKITSLFSEYFSKEEIENFYKSAELYDGLKMSRQGVWDLEMKLEEILSLNYYDRSLVSDNFSFERINRSTGYRFNNYYQISGFDYLVVDNFISLYGDTKNQVEVADSFIVEIDAKEQLLIIEDLENSEVKELSLTNTLTSLDSGKEFQRLDSDPDLFYLRFKFDNRDVQIEFNSFQGVEDEGQLLLESVNFNLYWQE